MNRRRKRNRDGFTLMEILLVAAILMIIASMATLGFSSMQRSATMKLTRNEIKIFEDSCGLFRTSNLRLPNKLEELVIPPSGVSEMEWGGPYLKEGTDLIDPWGTPYKYTVDANSELPTIISAGPDGQMGNKDDISNKKLKS